MPHDLGFECKRFAQAAFAETQVCSSVCDVRAAATVPRLAPPAPYDWTGVAPPEHLVAGGSLAAIYPPRDGIADSARDPGGPTAQLLAAQLAAVGRSSAATTSAAAAATDPYSAAAASSFATGPSVAGPSSDGMFFSPDDFGRSQLDCSQLDCSQVDQAGQPRRGTRTRSIKRQRRGSEDS